MRLTIVYLTFRLHPRFEWFSSSLAREFRSMPDVKREDVQIVVIDGRLWHEGFHRQLGLLDAAGGQIKFEHHPPKPSAWQGPSRQTSRDYFCAAASRNTAFCYAKGEHVIFVDDLSVLLPGWLKAHVHAADHNYVLAGTTCKNRNIEVDSEGTIVSYELLKVGQDSRIAQLSEALQPCGGGWLYGGTFSTPLSFALAVNGQDEICDTIGGEDYDFGTRLERAGAKVFISKACGTFEDHDAHHREPAMIRKDKPWEGPDGPYSSNRLLNLLHREHARTWTLGNDYKLRDLRDQVLGGVEFPQPKPDLRHWVDQQLLSEM